jgi:hypothetical protein
LDDVVGHAGPGTLQLDAGTRQIARCGSREAFVREAPTVGDYSYEITPGIPSTSKQLEKCGMQTRFTPRKQNWEVCSLCDPKPRSQVRNTIG